MNSSNQFYEQTLIDHALRNDGNQNALISLSVLLESAYVFDLQPSLSGKLVSPVLFRSQTSLCAFRCRIRSRFGSTPARDRYTESVFRRFFDDGMESGGAFVIHDLASGEVIGSRFCFYSQERDEIEIGFTF